MTLTCRLYRGGRLEDAHFDPSRISQILGEPETMVWVDVEGPTAETLAMLGSEF